MHASTLAGAKEQHKHGKKNLRCYSCGPHSRLFEIAAGGIKQQREGSSSKGASPSQPGVTLKEGGVMSMQRELHRTRRTASSHNV
jgi:hypothetical protein